MRRWKKLTPEVALEMARNVGSGSTAKGKLWMTRIGIAVPWVFRRCLLIVEALPRL